MAKFKMKTAGREIITLKLSHREADVLFSILGSCTGPVFEVGEIYSALAEGACLDGGVARFTPRVTADGAYPLGHVSYIGLGELT